MKSVLDTVFWWAKYCFCSIFGCFQIFGKIFYTILVTVLHGIRRRGNIEIKQLLNGTWHWFGLHYEFVVHSTSRCIFVLCPYACGVSGISTFIPLWSMLFSFIVKNTNKSRKYSHNVAKFISLLGPGRYQVY